MSKEDNEDIDFSIRNIFDKNSPKCALRRYEAEKYYIAPYQRGYKWAAESDNDAVCVFMKDLIDASQHPDRKYRLQFITTKRTKIDKGENKEWVLEVIDGQQRLTTLTILLSVLEYIIDGNNEKAISNYKLLYDIRKNVTKFFQEHIYQHIDTLMSDDDWDVFVKRYSKNDEPNIYDEQDIFYLYKAAQKIRKMLENEFSGPKDDIEKFRECLLDKVVITLIRIEHDYGIDSAEIFSNLNDNKVELKSSELVKGLILTEVSSNKEKIELRAIMGRQWDEISHWANREDIGTFFFDAKNDNVLDELLILLAVDDGFKDNISSKNDIFNYFLSRVKDDKKNVKDLFDKLKEIKAILNDWFNDDNIYNSLGYVLFRKKNWKKIPIFFKRKNTGDLPIIRYGKLELKKVLGEYICESLTTEDINTLQYEDDSEVIHDLLLAINVLGYKNRFDFTKFGKEEWSLEHIFPQTPNEFKGKLKQKDIYLLGQEDINLLKSLCGDNLGDFEKARDLLIKDEETKDEKTIGIIKTAYDLLSEKLKKESCELDSKEIETLYKLVKKDELNSIGNMALLTGKDNSSNSNGMFDKKRRNIVERITKGSFVPVHTYDVFSKLISEEMDPNLTVWTEKDIDTHTKWIKNKIEEIKREKTV